MSDFINVPESDYRLDEPDVKPLIVTLKFESPIEKEYPSKFDNSTYSKFYYTVDSEGIEYSLGATAALHKKIQETGATKDTEIKILKKRIGDDAKDIRWSVSHVGGPVDDAKVKVSQQGQSSYQSAPTVPTPTPNQSHAPSKEYEPLTNTGLAVWILDQQDEAALFSISITEARKLWPEGTEDRVLQATAASLFIQGTRHTNGIKGLNTLALPPEPDPIADIVAGIDGKELPHSFFEAVGANTDYYEDEAAIQSAMKALGRTGTPKGYHNQYEAVRDLLRYADFRENDMDVVDAVEAVIEAQENEPAF